MLLDFLSLYLRDVEAAVRKLEGAYVERYEEEIVAFNRVNLRIRVRFPSGYMLELNEAVIGETGQLMHLGCSGHLFQNRYKSVACEEDPYLLELIRYIHLNPLGAKLVQDLKELDKYPWTGHSAILGKRKDPLIPNEPDKPDKPEKTLAEKTIEDVLLHFDDTLRIARRRYRQFVKNGIDQGNRSDLQGGGLVRSAGGNKSGLLGRKKEEREKGDERILGSGDFVNEALMKAGEDWEKGKEKKMPLPKLIGKVASHLDLKGESILSKSRKRKISEARGIICYLAVNDMGYSTSEVAHALDVRRVSAGQCVTRGKKILDKNMDLRDKLIN